MAKNKFLEGIAKDLKKAGIEAGSAQPPRWWISCGNHVANYTMSGDFDGMIPQGRLTGIAGPSGAGKSFIAGNIIREAQKDGFMVVVLDSENALDDDFTSKIGVDPDHEDYMYFPVVTNAEVKTTVSNVVKQYRADYGDDGPKMLIVLDSLDMLLTDTEWENEKKGVQKGDQGQRNKQNKAMLRGFVHSIAKLNIAIVITCQVYENQDVMNGEGRWIVSGAVKFSLSQIAMLTKLKLKETGQREVLGIRMKVHGYKTRFAKPFQEVTIEVPYDGGMDPYNGLLEVAIDLGLAKKAGAYIKLTSDPDNNYRRTQIDEYGPILLDQLRTQKSTYLQAIVEEGEEEAPPDELDSMKKRRIKNVAGEDDLKDV
jgi:recombination protein RecA